MRPQVPPETLEKLRAICRVLPEAREETAWIGTRWRVRSHTFAHVLMIDAGSPPAYARAARTDGPACVLTFRSTIAALDPLNYAEAPFFRPRWFVDIVGLALDGATDWDAVAGLVEASYRALAPKGWSPGSRRPPRQNPLGAKPDLRRRAESLKPPP